MANGKKNYFRHSFFARNDVKLLKLRDEIGVGFYFYYFALLELCGEQSADELRDKYEFHNSTIKSLWGVNLKKSERISCVMDAVGLLEFEKREKTFMFRVSNLSKYLGKYTNKTTPNIVIKEKKRKEKERKEKETKKTPSYENEDLIIEYYNSLSKEVSNNSRGAKFTKNNRANISARIKDGFSVEDCKQAIFSVSRDPWFVDNGHFNLTTIFRPANFEKYLTKPVKETIEDVDRQFLELFKKSDDEDLARKNKAATP